MRRIYTAFTGTVIAILAFMSLASAGSVLVSDVAFAGTNIDKVQGGIDKVGGDQDGNRGGDFSETIKSVINILLFVIGIVAVLIIIIGGIRYTTSAGDANQTKGARDTIIYAVVGLVIAVMAFAIVNFVLARL